MATKVQASVTGRGDMFRFDPFKLVIIGYDTKDGPEHPLYDERVRALANPDPAKVKNVRAHGVIEPIVVRRDGDRTLVVAGRHRVVWARAASRMLDDEGEATIEVRGYYAQGDDGAMADMMISENEIRRDDPPLAKARKAAALIQTRGRSIEQAATAFGVSQQQVKNWLQLVTADESVLQAVEQNRINATKATEISRLARADQPAALEAAISSGASSVEVAAAVRAKRNGHANGKGEEETGMHARPTMAVIRKALKHLHENVDDVDPLVFQTLRWVAGEIDARSIKGLTGVLRSTGAEKE